MIEFQLTRKRYSNDLEADVDADNICARVQSAQNIRQAMNEVTKYNTGIAKGDVDRKKEFKKNHVEIHYGTLLESGDTSHFDIKYYGNDALVNSVYYYKQDDDCLYDAEINKKIKNNKLNHLYKKEVEEFTDKFGENMNYQIYNPF